MVKLEEIHNSLRTLNKKLRKHECSVMMHLNIRSLNANFKKLEILIKSLSVEPGIVVFSETWTLLCPLYFKLDGYDVYYNDSTINQNDDGVLYVKSEVRPKL